MKRELVDASVLPKLLKIVWQKILKQPSWKAFSEYYEHTWNKWKIEA